MHARSVEGTISAPSAHYPGRPLPKETANDRPGWPTSRDSTGWRLSRECSKMTTRRSGKGNSPKPRRPESSSVPTRSARRADPNAVAKSSALKARTILGDADYHHFWRGFLRVIGTEPQEVTSMTGATGVSHPVLIGGRDDVRSRLVVVAPCQDAREAALVRADLQAGTPTSQVLLIRPVLIDLPAIARSLRQALGRGDFRMTDLQSPGGQVSEAPLDTIGLPIARAIRSGGPTSSGTFGVGAGRALGRSGVDPQSR